MRSPRCSRRHLGGLVALAITIAGCTSASPDDTTVAPEATTTTSGSTTDDRPTTSATTPTTAASTTPTTSATPVTRGPDLPRADLGGFNIGHGVMNESVVELMWTSVDGDDVVHRVYRAPTIGTDPATADLAEATPVYAGPDLAVDDRTAPAGEFWTYILEIDADGVTAENRAWTSVLTVTDTTPPAEVTGLSAAVTGDGVLLRWNPADDDVEFGAYAVLLVNDDGTATYLGGGADVGLTSFLDDRPPAGAVTYRVQAVDYHDNRSTAEITVEVP